MNSERSKNNNRAQQFITYLVYLFTNNRSYTNLTKVKLKDTFQGPDKLRLGVYDRPNTEQDFHPLFFKSGAWIQLPTGILNYWVVARPSYNQTDSANVGKVINKGLGPEVCFGYVKWNVQFKSVTHNRPYFPQKLYRFGSSVAPFEHTVDEPSSYQGLQENVTRPPFAFCIQPSSLR